VKIYCWQQIICN